MIRGFLPAWDFARRHVDVAPVVDWALHLLDAELGLRPPSLERLHEVTDVAGAQRASQLLTARAFDQDARQLMRTLVRQAVPELPAAHVAVQATGHVRVLAPGDDRTPSTLHTDAAVGHDDEERTLWFALTRASGTAALQGASLASSIGPERARVTRGDMLFDDPALAPPTSPLDVEAGDVLLFTTRHVHGAVTNRETTTRVSIDIRVAPLVRARARNPWVWVCLEDR